MLGHSNVGTTDLSLFTVKILHGDLAFPKLCKACDIVIESVESMRDHFANSASHKENTQRLGYFSKTNPCGHCDIEMVT